jgi:hypothetical protein
MRRHKAVARIFLFLSIVNFTFAGIAQTPKMHEMRVDLVTGAQDVAEALSEGHAQSAAEETPELLKSATSTAGTLQSRFDLIPAQSFSTRSIMTDDPAKDKFFTEELKGKMKEYLVLGAVAGVFPVLRMGYRRRSLVPCLLARTSFSFQLSCRHLNGPHSDHAIYYPSTRVGRAVNPLDELPQDQEDRVSRSLSSMRDEDLRMLSIMSRRMHNRLDRRAAAPEMG